MITVYDLATEVEPKAYSPPQPHGSEVAEWYRRACKAHGADWAHERALYMLGAAIGRIPVTAGPYNLIGEEESAPDARLIAAAPELLSAVRQYRSDMLHPDIADDSRKRRIEMIDRVIAKATSP